MSTPYYFAPAVAESGEAVKLAMQRLWIAGKILPPGRALLCSTSFDPNKKSPRGRLHFSSASRRCSTSISHRRRRLRSPLGAKGNRSRREGLRGRNRPRLAFDAGPAIRRRRDQSHVGNIRPGETVTVYLEILAGIELRGNGFRFRFPFTLAPAYHPRAKAALAASGVGELELPPDKFGDVILPQLSSRRFRLASGRVRSLRDERVGNKRTRVAFARDPPYE